MECSIEFVKRRWMAPLLLLLDLHERMAASSQRKLQMELVVVSDCHLLNCCCNFDLILISFNLGSCFSGILFHCYWMLRFHCALSFYLFTSHLGNVEVHSCCDNNMASFIHFLYLIWTSCVLRIILCIETLFLYIYWGHSYHDFILQWQFFQYE